MPHMMKTDLLSPPLTVVHTSMGTTAIIEMDVIHPTAAISRTIRGTLGDAYFLNLRDTLPDIDPKVASKHAGQCSMTGPYLSSLA
jgi:hypothetical protein